MDYDQLAQSCLDEPFYAQQKRTELAGLLEFLDTRNPRRILEIGTYKGGTIQAWTNIASLDAVIVGVDLKGARFGGGFNKEEAKKIKTLAQHDQTIHLLNADSHHLSTKERALELLGDRPDMIFIDGDHTYEGVKKDFLMYFEELAPGGVLVLHDILPHTNYHDVGVNRLWENIKNGKFKEGKLAREYSTKIKEFTDLDYPTDHGIWGGLGVVIKK